MTTISIPYFDLSDRVAGADRSSSHWKPVGQALSSGFNSPENHSNRPSVTEAAHAVALPAPIKNPEVIARLPSQNDLNPTVIGSGDPELQLARIKTQLQGVQSKSTAKRVASRQDSNPAIERLTYNILDRFPIAAPSIILFVGTQSNPLISATCASVADALADKSVGEILLVDSSVDRMLSKSFQVADHGGLSNLLIDPREWKSNLCKLPSSGLDFLPAGTSHWEHWGSETRLRQLAVELRCRYQFVCVAASDPQDPNSRVWTSVCDGSFLLVSLKNANQLIAQSAVVELQSNGARLLGCVVTDADAMLP